jgi:hypothetical protein
MYFCDFVIKNWRQKGSSGICSWNFIEGLNDLTNIFKKFVYHFEDLLICDWQYLSLRNFNMIAQTLLMKGLMSLSAHIEILPTRRLDGYMIAVHLEPSGCHRAIAFIWHSVWWFWVYCHHVAIKEQSHCVPIR